MKRDSNNKKLYAGQNTEDWVMEGQHMYYKDANAAFRILQSRGIPARFPDNHPKDWEIGMGRVLYVPPAYGEQATKILYKYNDKDFPEKRMKDDSITPSALLVWALLIGLGLLILTALIFGIRYFVSR
jgi:hypothetical protein